MRAFNKKYSVPVKKIFEESAFQLPKIKNYTKKRDKTNSAIKLEKTEKKYLKTDAAIKQVLMDRG